MGDRPAVELRGVTKDYGRVRAVDGVSLAVQEGEFLAILGPSGCGKTTTLHLIAGFIQPTAGRVLIDGRDVTGQPAYLRRLGVVFQHYALFPHMTVFENVAFGLRMRKLPRAEVGARVRDALALVRLDGYEGYRPRQLSGGQQQRVAMARALVFQPRVLLLDEPLAALDKKLRDEMRAELKEIQRRVGITTIFVTHDQQEALGLSDRIAVMAAGRIEQLGTPREIYQRPAARFVADFVGASNILSAKVVWGRGESLGLFVEGMGEILVRSACWLRPLPVEGDHVELLIRPERVALLADGADPGENTFPGRVEATTYLGPHTEVRVRLAGGQRLMAALDEADFPGPLEAGAAVQVRLDPGQFLVG